MRLRNIKPRQKLLLMFAGAVSLVLIGVVVGFFVLLSGAMSTAATTQHFRITHALLDLGLQFSVRRSAQHIPVPPLDDARKIAQGALCYQLHCEQCHGGPGRGRLEHARGLLPEPSNLVQSAREWPANWLYYVTKKGVRMTGMPAWEYRLADESIWSTVAFLKALPFLTREDYLAIEQRASGQRCTTSYELPIETEQHQAKVVLRQYSCHSCHEIEGVVGPQTHVGPPLKAWGARKYIAGVAPNTKENLMRFIRNPQALSPQTLMPNLDVAEQHADVMATYLLDLK